MTRRTFLAASAFAARRWRAALIGHTGRGNFGHDWDLSFKDLPNVETVAVADPVEAGRAKALARSGAKRGYSDYREMLAKEKPDIAAICPRHTDQRLEMVTAAAETGAHILLEKPFAMDLKQADAIVEVASRHRILIQVGHTGRIMKVHPMAVEMIRAGEIGQLMEIRARGKEDRRAGGEDLIVLGGHCFDLMRAFAGEPKSIHATIQGPVRQPTEPVGLVRGTDVAATILFDSGIHGYWGSRRSDVTDGERFGIAMLGSKGAIFMPLTKVPNDELLVTKSTSWTGQWKRVEPPPAERNMSRAYFNGVMAKDLMDAVEQHRQPLCSARDGQVTMEMIAAMYQSAALGASVRFPLVDRSMPVVTPQ